MAGVPIKVMVFFFAEKTTIAFISFTLSSPRLQLLGEGANQHAFSGEVAEDSRKHSYL